MNPRYFIWSETQRTLLQCGKLANQFQKKTSANKLELRRKLYVMCLKEGESIQNHVKVMTESFEALAVIDDPVSEEDCVVIVVTAYCYV